MNAEENSIIAKKVIFEFFYTFTDLFYIAFINFDIVGLKNELVSIFVIDEFRRIFTETLIPLVFKKIRAWKQRKTQAKLVGDRKKDIFDEKPPETRNIKQNTSEQDKLVKSDEKLPQNSP